MNAVEIEEAVSELAAAPFDAAEFPFAFLSAFGSAGSDRVSGHGGRGPPPPHLTAVPLPRAARRGG